MYLDAINKKLALGEIDDPALFPHLKQLQETPWTFEISFGLDLLPETAGILLIRGARQYGKSTWLEQELRQTIKQWGPGTAFYLNGDSIPSEASLEEAIQNLLPLFSKNAHVKRIFIDEITAIPRWEIALKRLADEGRLSETLLITTGSKATDLRRGVEKLPGRKGKLSRSAYIFTPLSYSEFHRVCGKTLGEETWLSYLLSGGSPIACSELASYGFIPEYVIELVRDWVEGEVASSGRSRTALLNIMITLFRLGGSPIGQSKLAREAGLANNTVAQGYLEILQDLGCLTPSYPWDPHRKILILRKPCKYHFTNVLVALAYHPGRIRSPQDFLKLPESQQAMWYEWLVAQEIQRRKAIAGQEMLAPLAFWQNDKHEIDFVTGLESFIEVKRGGASPIEFAWFPHQMPGKHLTVINTKSFETPYIQGITLEKFLLKSV